MTKFFITKEVEAKSMVDAIRLEKKGTIIEVVKKNDTSVPSTTGFDTK